MIEQAFSFGASFGTAAQPYPFLKRAVEQFRFRRFTEDLIQRFVRNRALDLLHREALLQSPAANRLLPHFRRRIAQRVAFVVEVTILAQSRDHSFDDCLARTAFRQTLAQLRD